MDLFLIYCIELEIFGLKIMPKILKRLILTLLFSITFSWGAAEEEQDYLPKWQVIYSAIESEDIEKAVKCVQEFPNIDYLSTHKYSSKTGYSETTNTLLTFSFTKKAWKVSEALIEKGIDLSISVKPANPFQGGEISPLNFFLEIACPFEGEVVQIAKVLMDKNVLYQRGRSFLSFFLAPNLGTDKGIGPRPQEIEKMVELIGSQELYLTYLFSGLKPAVIYLNSSEMDPDLLFKEYKDFLQADSSRRYQKTGMLEFSLWKYNSEISWPRGQSEFLQTYYPATPTVLPPGNILRNTLNEFPQNELWRLLVDGQVQTYKEEKGWNGYEQREEGCIGAMIQALGTALKEVRHLDLELYKQIHDECLSSTKLPKGQALGSRVGLMPHQTLSLMGFLELQDLASNGWFFLAPTYSDGSYKCTINHEGRSRKLSTVEEIIFSYHDAIKGSISDLNKLKAIIQLASDLDRFHYYADGNCRTALIIAQRELVRHGFSPIVLENPNRLDGFSQEELLEEFLKGMHTFDFIKQNKRYPKAPEGLETETLSKTVPIEKSKFFKTAIPEFWENFKKIPDRL